VITVTILLFSSRFKTYIYYTIYPWSLLSGNWLALLLFIILFLVYTLLFMERSSQRLTFYVHVLTQLLCYYYYYYIIII
jgi:hypothetical protein